MTDLPTPLDADSSDEQLWRAVVAGDPAAFGVFFRRHSPAVHRFCFRRTGSTQLAEDLTSVVFLQAWRSRGGVDLDTVPVRAWLFGIANHVTANGTRSVRRHQGLLARVQADQPAPDHADAVAARIDDERTMIAVLALVRVLPKAERDVLHLCVFAELPYAEAAVALDIPVGTVRSRLSRARGHLQARIAAAPLDQRPSPLYEGGAQ